MSKLENWSMTAFRIINCICRFDALHLSPLSSESWMLHIEFCNIRKNVENPVKPQKIDCLNTLWRVVYKDASGCARKYILFHPSLCKILLWWRLARVALALHICYATAMSYLVWGCSYLHVDNNNLTWYHRDDMIIMLIWWYLCQWLLLYANSTKDFSIVIQKNGKPEG